MNILALSFEVLLYAMVFGTTLVFFLLAVARQTVLTCLVSFITWYGSAAFTMFFAEETGAVVPVAWLCMMMGTLMLIATVWSAFKFMGEAAKAKESKFTEEPF